MEQLFVLEKRKIMTFVKRLNRFVTKHTLALFSVSKAEKKNFPPNLSRKTSKFNKAVF